MVRRLPISSRLMRLGLFVITALPAIAQNGFQIPPVPEAVRPSYVLDHYLKKPSLPVAFSIPVGPLGFSIPGDSYLLRKQSLVSLDFLSEDRILFTFRVSALMQRDGSDRPDDQKQQIRAVVLSLPDGKAETQTEWVVPDRLRYLWMLNQGHFLLRVRDGLDEGDSALKLNTYLYSPNRLLWIQMDPGQHLIITNCLESANSFPGSVSQSETPSPADLQKDGAHPVLVARTLNRSSGEAIRVSRFPWTSQTNDWPMNSEGYLEKAKEGDRKWVLNLNYFLGGSRPLAHIDSTCAPKYDFLSDTSLLLSRCDPESGWKFGLMSTDGKSKWEVKAGTNAIWPSLVAARTRSRAAREMLLLKHSAYKYKRMLTAKDVQGQMVKVFDLTDGKVLMEAPLTPILDGGGNVAISPSGQRIAILNDGAIQVFQLPASTPGSDSH